jgi:predicted nucleic acid-binding protein
VVVPATAELFAAGMKLFRSRIDKEWGLTDCTSFVIMQERKLHESLTSDDHFRQAEFSALLLEVA